MKERKILTWFLGIMVVLLTVALALETTYLVWLHRQLYTAVAGTGSSLQDLDKLLSMEIDPSISHVQKPGAEKSDKAAPGVKEQSLFDGLGDLSDVQGIDGIHERAEQIVAEALSDPALRDLLGDLGVEAPGAKPAPKAAPKAPALKPLAPQAFRPTFDFRDEGGQYVVTMALPGVNPSEVYTVVEGQELKVSGTRNGQAFSESLAFPGPIDEKSVEVSIDDEKLTVTARKPSLAPLGAA